MNKSPTRILFVVATLLGFFFHAISNVCADLVIDLPEVTVQGDGVNDISGEFVVYLTATEPELSTPPLVSSFNLDFSVTGSAVTFDTTTAPTVTPLFVGGDLQIVLDPTRVRYGHDIYDETPSSVEALDGDALVKVFFTVEAGESGTWALEFNNLNEIANNLATPLNLTLLGGSITAEIVAIPETSAWLGLGIIALGSWVTSRSRSRRRESGSSVRQV